MAVRYFQSDHCRDSEFRGLDSLDDAIRRRWKDVGAEELKEIRERLRGQLSSGAFRYVLLAQRFTPSVERSIEYLNAVASGPRFYAVELVRFTGGGLSAFETRTMIKPASRDTIRSSQPTTEAEFLAAIEDQRYGGVLSALLEQARKLGLRSEWGSVGVSLRLPTPDGPLSIAWLFPPGRAGWMGLTDLTLGYDSSSAKLRPSVGDALDEYVKELIALPGTSEARPRFIAGVTLTPGVAVAERDKVATILERLVTNAGLVPSTP